jgi:DNA-binding transcriptional MocR family regulator
MRPSAARLYDEPSQLRALTRFAAADFAADGLPSSAMTVTSGALDAIERILREHLRHGDRVAVEDPCFPPLLDMLEIAGFVAEPFAVDEEGPVVESFARALGRHPHAVIVTPRAQNPYGSAITADRARDLRAALRPHRDVLVVENDPAGPIAGAPMHTLCDGRHAAWAVVRSTSKFLGPDLRMAVVTGDATTVARVERRHAVGPRWVSHILQRLACALWADPSGARRLARAADVYAARRRALVSALAAHGIEAHGRSGLNVWVPVEQEAAAVRGLAARGWAVAAGEPFRLRTGPAIRITTSALAPADAQRLAADLADARRRADAARA